MTSYLILNILLVNKILHVWHDGKYALNCICIQVVYKWRHNILGCWLVIFYICFTQLPLFLLSNRIIELKVTRDLRGQLTNLSWGVVITPTTLDMWFSNLFLNKFRNEVERANGHRNQEFFSHELFHKTNLCGENNIKILFLVIITLHI